MTTKKRNQSTQIMEDSKQFKLISGDFSATDATSIVLSFYNTKIVFHNQELLRMAEQGVNGAAAIELKIAQLNVTKKAIIEFLQNATKDHQTLQIDGVINMTICD